VKKASLNLIDKAVAFLNPQGAVDRLVARQKLVNFSYDAVKYNRERKGPSSLSGAEDYRSNYDRVELMKRARDLAENVGLVRSILMKFASHTAANISYQARTENPEVNTDVEAYWAEWWDRCDITTRHTGSTLMQVAMMSMLRDGDFLIVLVRDRDGNLKIQGIEADRVGDPFRTYTSLDLIGGIHIDRNTGAPTAYDIFNRSIGDFYTYQATIPSSQAFHLFDPLRIDQYRGVSAFHTAINDCTDIYDIINFEKMSAKLASSQSGIVKRNNNNASDLSSLTNDEDVNGNTIKLEAIQSGKISYLEPGEDIVFPDGPSRPSGAFAEFHKILLRNICLGLGIPYSFAVDPSAMSGPTARLEMQQAGRTFRRYQKLLDDKVLRPIKNIVIADAVSRGLIENNVGSRTTKGIFNFGANVSIDLGRESASAISEFKTGLRTAADIYAERGQDFESAMRQRAIEAKLIKDLAEKYGVAPETISDIVTPTPPQPQQPTAPAPKPVAPAKDEPEEGEDEGGDQKPIPEDPIDPSSEELEVKKKETDLEGNCGTGAGGFQPGNECSKGGGEGAETIQQRASRIAKDIGGKVVGSASREGGKPRDIDILLKESEIPQAIDKLKKQGYENYGNQLVSPEEAKASGKSFTGNWSRLWRMKKGNDKIDLWHSDEGILVPEKKLQAVLESLDPTSIKMLIEGMMGGIELAKYDGIDFTPPQGAREAAKRALDVREGKPASQRGMTPVGIARARDLMNGVKLSPDTVRRMLNFLTRHEVDKKGSTWDEQGKGWQAWHGWGGDAGYSWAKKIVGQMDARDNKELARPVSQTPAPPKERIKGSKENPEGTASTRSKAGDIEISAENEEALKNKIAEFKDKHPSRKAPTLGALKKVFRRGAGAFSTSFRPTITGGKPNSRNAWAMARVNKFLKMAGGGEVKESYRKADGDLLEERFDCGTGAGGFREGNTCAGGGGGKIEISNKIEKNKQFIDDVDRESKNNKEKIIFVRDGKKISETYGVDDRADLTEEQKNLLKSSKGEITTIHNHPQESIPSSLDIGLFAGSGGEHIISTPTSIYKINIDKKTEDEARKLSGNYAGVNYKIQKELNSYLSDRFPRKMGGGAGIDGFSYRNKGEFEKAKKAEKKISESIFSDFAKTNGFTFNVIDKKD
jgi:lambda family phage portal protein